MRGYGENGLRYMGNKFVAIREALRQALKGEDNLLEKNHASCICIYKVVANSRISN